MERLYDSSADNSRLFTSNHKCDETLSEKLVDQVKNSFRKYNEYALERYYSVKIYKLTA